MSVAISVENLSKLYRINGASASSAAPAGYRTLRETICDVAAAPLRRLRGRRTGEERSRAGACDELWALKDVSFKVRTGEVLGVVGRNGAGKSTLLKILSRITSPTAGCAELRGRVGSLLEVGTGFHPELTGRENIYLNGAILGLTRREIQRKFDEIVAFAEVERFLDTPVKRYSSGMHTRLAFAVASHLEPEILVVDEVLAVGDAAFQKKCMGKMGQVSRRGRTVLFVSHNMSAIKSLCTRAILIENGRIACDGSVDEAVNRYLQAGAAMFKAGVIPDEAPRVCDCPGEARLRSVRLTDQAGQEVGQVYFRQPIRVTFTCEVLKALPDAHFEVSVSTLEGIHVTYSTTTDGGRDPVTVPPGLHEITVELDVTLLPRGYTIDLGVHHQNGWTVDFVQRTLDFTVLGVAEDGRDHYQWARTRGLVRAPARWSSAGGLAL
jgi:lipopolysaccharide transport system ATP-binding protein